MRITCITSIVRDASWTQNYFLNIHTIELVVYQLQSCAVSAIWRQWPFLSFPFWYAFIFSLLHISRIVISPILSLALLVYPMWFAFSFSAFLFFLFSSYNCITAFGLDTHLILWWNTPWKWIEIARLKLDLGLSSNFLPAFLLFILSLSGMVIGFISGGDISDRETGCLRVCGGCIKREKCSSHWSLPTSLPNDPPQPHCFGHCLQFCWFPIPRKQDEERQEGLH